MLPRPALPAAIVGTVAVIVPIKSFELAKGRLAEAVEPAERASLARRMAARVLGATHHLPAFVVCDDDEVAAFALEHGAEVVRREARGLNAAVDDGRAALAAFGYERMIVAHADLPLACDLTWVGALDGVTIVPDRRGDGTNVMALPTDAPFRFAYGPGSAALHEAEARRVGLGVRRVTDDELGWDVDVPDDLAVLEVAAPCGSSR